MSSFRWTADHIAAIARSPIPTSPLIAPGSVERVVPGIDLWDHWPVLDTDGALAETAGGLLVVALSAPVEPDPEDRHAIARLRLLHRSHGGWRDLGPLLPDDLCPGSREWAGSAILDRGSGRVTLYYTAAGQRDERVLSFQQRLFATSATLAERGGHVALTDWTPPRELVAPDGLRYLIDTAGGGTPGTIKAFRDPWFFRSPATGNDWLLFAASRADAASPWNGMIGAARRADDRAPWTLAMPLVDATGVTNELERPHAITHAGRVYLFWSTQAQVFARGLSAPTGLYGAVSDGIEGPWQALNGSGLVFANPDAAPAQAYSWQVLPNLEVWGFANYVGLADPAASRAERRASFGGSPAPILRLALEGTEARLLGA